MRTRSRPSSSLSEDRRINTMSKQLRPSLFERVRSIAILCLVLVSATFSTQRQVKAASAPKAYIGLYKDNAVAVLDTGTNQVLTTIKIPDGPHGLAITPDGKT